MLDSAQLRTSFGLAHDYASHLASGKEEHQQRWRQVYERLALTEDQCALVGGFERRMNVLVLSGTWCGDCVAQCPMMQRIAEANTERIDLRFVDRDAHIDLAQQVRINAGLRVPTVIFMAEDYEFVALFGDRTLSRYRSIASKQLGVACPLLGAHVNEDSEVATLAEWVNEFERVALLLRLSPRLRKKHSD